MPLPETPENNTEVLRQMLEHLERMDRRDRIRTYGGFVRTLISLIPIVFMALSLWYVYANMDDLIRKITEESAKRAAEYTKTNSQEFMQNMQNLLKR